MLQRLVSGACLIVPFFALSGCKGDSGPAPPPTFPVTGKVTFKDGTPLVNGAIGFTSAADQTLSIHASIKADGTFDDTFTVLGKQRVKGAPEGELDVRIFPPQGADQSSYEVSVVPTKITVKAGETNHFEFIVQKK